MDLQEIILIALTFLGGWVTVSCLAVNVISYVVRHSKNGEVLLR